MDFDELGVVIAEGIMMTIATHTSGDLADYDDDIRSKVDELTDIVLEKYTTYQEEEEESDTELHGDMDTFPG